MHFKRIRFRKNVLKLRSPGYSLFLCEIKIKKKRNLIFWLWKFLNSEKTKVNYNIRGEALATTSPKLVLHEDSLKILTQKQEQ